MRRPRLHRADLDGHHPGAHADDHAARHGGSAQRRRAACEPDSGTQHIQGPQEQPDCQGPGSPQRRATGRCLRRLRHDASVHQRGPGPEEQGPDLRAGRRAHQIRERDPGAARMLLRGAATARQRMEKSMKINGRVVIAVMTLGLGAWIGSGAGHADAGVIFPVDPSTGALNTGAPATVSLFQNGRDVTDKWLPAWTPGGGGEPVFVVFNVQGVVTAPTSLALVPPPTNPVFNGTTNPFLVPPKTSAYPGNCTNYGSDTTADYDFNTTAEPVTASINGFRLTPRDCGGMAVVSATLNGASY